MKRTKIVMICAAILASVSLVSLTACSPEKPSASSSASSTVTSETSASLGIYIYDTDNDGTPDQVVDRYGADLSELYTLKEDGIYEGDSLVLPLEQTEAFVPVTELAFTVTEKTVHPDPENSFTLDLVVTPENATTKEFELTTDNTEVLKIENGSITALASGEATVTATAKAGGATATCKVIVNAEAEEAETQNEQAIASGGTIYNSNNTNNKNTVTANTNTGTGTTNHSANNQTGGNIAGNSGGGNTNNNATGGTTNNGHTGGGNTNTTQPDPQPEQPQPTVHAPIYKKQWVVDTAAWTEEVPVYEMIPVMICNDCGVHLNAGNCWEHIENHAMNGGKGSWTDTYEKQQTGTKQIYHEEVGHYENVLVCGGCTGTH